MIIEYRTSMDVATELAENIVGSNFNIREIKQGNSQIIKMTVNETRRYCQDLKIIPTKTGEKLVEPKPRLHNYA